MVNISEGGHRNPYTLRARCWRCHGRRLVVVDHIDYIELVPCPSCHHRGPSEGGRVPAVPVTTMARAA